MRDHFCGLYSEFSLYINDFPCHVTHGSSWDGGRHDKANQCSLVHGLCYITELYALYSSEYNSHIRQIFSAE